MIACAAAIAVVCASAQPAAKPTSTTLKVGDMAPDFTMPSTAGGKVSLADFKGKKTVVLAFFPAAFTGGCTKEMQTYGLGIDKFTNSDAVVFGVSTDNTPSQKEFATKLGLGFAILSDFKDRKVSKDYGVLLEQGVDNRVTFVIGKDGKIEFMEGGADAIATLGAGDACSRLAHKKASE
jgi:peroxiredoxin